MTLIIRQFLILLVLLVSLPLPGLAASIMINEYKNDTGTNSSKMNRSEFIEFVLTEDMTAVQLANLTFGDSNGSTSSLQGVFAFDLPTLTSTLSSAGLSAYLKGTIIVVKGALLGAQNLTYNPTVANATNNDAWSIELVAGLGAKDHSETRIDGSINISNQGDVVWVASGVPSRNTSTSNFIDAVGHDNSPGLIATNVVSQFGSNHILNGTISSPASVYNIAGATVSLAQSSTSTMAAPNGGANTLWIVNTLRGGSIPEPSRALLLALGSGGLLLRRRRSARA